MEQFKKAQVIMLPTEINNYHRLNSIRLFNNKLSLDTYTETFNSKHPMKTGLPIQHLYITSDDEIKENDWLYDSFNSKIFKYRYNIRDFKTTKKIVATTDTSFRDNYANVLPQPSQQFIEKYIESYNKNEVIKDVFIEYIHYDEFGNYISGDIINIKQL